MYGVKFIDLVSLAPFSGDEFTQDIASKGIGIIYELGDEKTKAKLVETLVSTLSGGVKTRKQKFTAETRDEKLFEEGELGSTPGKNGTGLSTYVVLLFV